MPYIDRRTEIIVVIDYDDRFITKVRHASNVKPTCYYKTFTLGHRALSIHYFHSEILFLFVIIRSTISIRSFNVGILLYFLYKNNRKTKIQ